MTTKEIYIEKIISHMSIEMTHYYQLLSWSSLAKNKTMSMTTTIIMEEMTEKIARMMTMMIKMMVPIVMIKTIRMMTAIATMVMMVTMAIKQLSKP